MRWHCVQLTDALPINTTRARENYVARVEDGGLESGLDWIRFYGGFTSAAEIAKVKH